MTNSHDCLFRRIYKIGWTKNHLGGRGGGYLCREMPSYPHKNYHYKDTKASWPPYLYNGISYDWKDGLHIESWLLLCFPGVPFGETGCPSTPAMMTWKCFLLLALCEGNPPVTGGFPSQRVSNVTSMFNFAIRLNRRKRWVMSVLKQLNRADCRIAPSQWETSLQSNAISHWLGANLESVLLMWHHCDAHTHTPPILWNEHSWDFIIMTIFPIVTGHHPTNQSRTPLLSECVPDKIVHFTRRKKCPLFVQNVLP